MIPISPSIYAHIVLSGSNLNAQSRARKYLAGLTRAGGARLPPRNDNDRRPRLGFDTNQFRTPPHDAQASEHGEVGDDRPDPGRDR